jgi:ribosomal-protein-alanine N-acetyltransferase
MRSIPAEKGLSVQTEIQTERLKLMALTMDQLRLCLDAPEQLDRELGFPISRDNLTEPARRAITMKLDKMSGVGDELHPWYTYWLVVIAAEPFGAGLAGFKGAPDPDGTVEIGYGIDPAYRNRGYTTEAARALIAWAFQDPDCRTVIAPDTRKDNVASNRVLAKVGMHVYDESDDALSWKIGSVVDE